MNFPLDQQPQAAQLAALDPAAQTQMPGALPAQDPAAMQPGMIDHGNQPVPYAALLRMLQQGTGLNSAQQRFAQQMKLVEALRGHNQPAPRSGAEGLLQGIESLSNGIQAGVRERRAEKDLHTAQDSSDAGLRDYIGSILNRQQ